MATGMANIEHLVVLMLENRSLDNLLGWTWQDTGNEPRLKLPPGSTAAYDGLVPDPGDGTHGTYWNPENPAFFHGEPAQKLFIQRGADDFTVPDPDPEELFSHMTFQIFGPQPPLPSTQKTMRGFYLDYLKATKGDAATAGQIMQSYTPDQLPVLNALAREFAVSDAWFCSCPCQTWPNRAFVHTGTSNGRVNNGFIPNPFDFDIPTIYNVLEEQGHTWGVYNDTRLVALTRLQFPKLWPLHLDDHFHGLHTWKGLAASGDLPTYSFLEPSFVIEPNDEHPPHDMRPGEALVREVYEAVRTSPVRDSTLLVVMFDENGGCSDHVTPPFGAVTPDAASNPGEDGFTFDRFGPRIPLVVVSPYVEAGTVFRTDNGTPYDHTSILATLRDWLGLDRPGSQFLTSHRIVHAPTLDQVLTRSAPREMPEIPPPAAITDENPLAEVSMQEPPNVLQDSMVIAAEAGRLGRPLTPAEAEALRALVPTRADAAVRIPLRSTQDRL